VWLRAVRVFLLKRTLAIEVGAGKQKSRPDAGLEPDVRTLDLPNFYPYLLYYHISILMT